MYMYAGAVFDPTARKGRVWVASTCWGNICRL